jgi:hypothetical protein
MFPRDQGYYTSAAVCLNGHPDSADISASAAAKFCSSCGEPVITFCPECQTDIRGHYVPPGVSGVGGRYSPPSFCSECGKALPWTARKIAAAKDLADDLEDVSPDERAKLKTSIDQVAGGGAQSEVAALRLKRALSTGGTAVGRALWKIVVDVASEAAKKTLLGS